MMRTNPFRTFFYFSKSDRRAVVAVGCIVVFAVGVMMVVDALKTNGPEAAKHAAGQDSATVASAEETPSVPLHVFDPNTVDSLTLIGFGIEAWKVKNFLRYRAAGKVFRSAEDLGDTYGWTAEDVQRLSPYVSVGTAFANPKRNTTPRDGKRKGERDSKPVNELKKFQTLTVVDVNEADTALLRRIPGIGRKISEAIVRYRHRLGGFHSVEQLGEIPIVSPELLEWFTVAPQPSLRQINLNKASFQALNAHPYISYEQTKALLRYIRLYGDVEDEETLLYTRIFTPEELDRLRPYITYE
ncbi:MAG: helix-hairpin-helix domain-containing protein [Bacteroidaceae bacterium]|nr:helix-hairpin-helix domain-containing protein [Bacteroidaceae bacterium]